MSNLQEIFGPSSPASEEPLFQELKPRCVALCQCILTSKPNNRELTATLVELHATLRRIPHDQLDDKLGDYIFYPLSHVFHQYQKLNDRSIELALQCLEILICTCWRSQIESEMAKELLILLTFVVGGNLNQHDASTGNRSEETKLAGCKCLLHLFGSLERSTRTVVENFESLPAVGHTVTTLVTVFSEANMLELQLMALQAMEKLFMGVIKDDDTRGSFYPGVVSGLVIALGLGNTTRRPYQVLKHMVKMLDKLISSVLDDRHYRNLPDSNEDQSKGSDTLIPRRTKPWFKTTAANTKGFLEKLLKLRTHPRIEVRTALFELSRNLLESCITSLDEATTILVETLVVISGDINNSLARLAENTVRVMASIEEKIKGAVRGCLGRWITSLPRVMTGNDEDAKQRVIMRLSIAFGLCMELDMEPNLLRDMLADGIKESLIAVNASTKSRAVLVRTTSVQPRLEMLFVDRPLTSSRGKIAKFSDVIVGQRSQMNTMENMKQLLESLGKSSENGLSLAQRHLRDASMRGVSINERATSFWIALNLLRGSLSASNEMDLYLDYGGMEAPRLQINVVDELLALALSSLTTSVEDEAESTENATTHCLALEALSLVAETHKRQFRGNLVDALYPVVHHLGSTSAEVQNHAVIALNNIAHSCEYPNAKDLLLDNVDYMINAVSLKLNIFDLSPQAPVVLNMMLKLVGPKLVPHLDDLIVSIFSILDGFNEYEKLCEELFMVLGAIVEESAKGDTDVKTVESGEYPSRKRRRLMDDNELIQVLGGVRNKNRPCLDPLDMLEQEDSDPESLKEFPRKPWMEGNGKQKEDAPLDALEDGDDDQHAPPPPEEEPPKPSKTYEIVQRITRLSQHYLTHGSFSLRAKVLRLISNASSTLSANEREYLPVINDIWPVVYTRLFDHEPGVVIQACQAISGIAESSGDFLSSRVKEGWPGLRKIYVQAYGNIEKERRVRTANMGVYGANYKVWDAILKMLTTLVRHVGVQDDILDEICGMCGGKILIERDDLREALEMMAPDSVWLEIGSLSKGTRWEDKVPILGDLVFLQPVF